LSSWLLAIEKMFIDEGVTCLTQDVILWGGRDVNL